MLRFEKKKKKSTAAIEQNNLFCKNGVYNTILKCVLILGHFLLLLFSCINWPKRPKSQIIAFFSVSWNKSLMYNT